MFLSKSMFHGNHSGLMGPPEVPTLRVIRTAFGGHTVALKVTEMTAREVV
jgi:hypothetical protein